MTVAKTLMLQKTIVHPLFLPSYFSIMAACQHHKALTTIRQKKKRKTKELVNKSQTFCVPLDRMLLVF